HVRRRVRHASALRSHHHFAVDLPSHAPPVLPEYCRRHHGRPFRGAGRGHHAGHDLRQLLRPTGRAPPRFFCPSEFPALRRTAPSASVFLLQACTHATPRDFP